MTFLCVAKIILWFLTRFKYLKILRKLFSNSLSFAVFLPIVRDITPMKQTWKNYNCRIKLGMCKCFICEFSIINQWIPVGATAKYRNQTYIFSVVTTYTSGPNRTSACVQGALVIDENGTRIKYRWIWNYFVYMFNLYQT